MRPLRFSLTAAIAIALFSSDSIRAAGYICAEGGGGLAKGRWAESVFDWMMQHGGARRVVVLGYHLDPDESVERIFGKAGAASVTHLVVADRRAAHADATADALAEADIIWMRGGDQSKYVRHWRGTKTEEGIRAVYDRGGVIGGTSAGAAVLGEVIYDAFNGSLTSAEALANPYHPVLTLSVDFLNLTPGVLFDTHFTERGRLGRLAVMLARRYEDAQQDLIGVGLDYRTALCVHPDLRAEVRGEGTVTFIHRTEQTQQIIQRGRQPAITDLAYTQLTAGDQYDLRGRAVIRSPVSSRLEPGRARTPPRFSACQIDGSNEEDEAKGAWRVLDGGDRGALFNGTLEAIPAHGELGQAVVVTRLWDGDRHVENAIGGAQWTLSAHRGTLALFVPSGTRIEGCAPAILRIQADGSDKPATMILDAATSSKSSIDNNDSKSVGIRQTARIDNARLQVLGDGCFYNAALGMPILRRSVCDLNADQRLRRDDLVTLAELLMSAVPATWQLESVDADGDGRINDADIDPFLDALLTNRH